MIPSGLVLYIQLFKKVFIPIEIFHILPLYDHCMCWEKTRRGFQNKTVKVCLCGTAGLLGVVSTSFASLDNKVFVHSFFVNCLKTDQMESVIFSVGFGSGLRVGGSKA